MKRYAALLLPLLLLAASQPEPAYRPAGSVALGSPDRWDYAVIDANVRRLYIAHGDRLAVLSVPDGKPIGQVEDIPGGTHGTAVSAATGQGFTDDGKNGLVIAFDLKTLKIVKRITADQDADGIVADKATGHIFVMEGDPHAISVIDPATDMVVATIKTGEKLEYAAADDRGSVYVAGEGSSDLLRIDTRSNRVTARWPAPDCVKPHGLAIDAKADRLFMGCVNSVMMVIDARSGRIVARLPIGQGSDTVAYDPVRRRVFSSNGADGTVTVYQMVSPDRYAPLATVPTLVSGRTMAVDPASGRLFVVAANTDPAATPGGRPRPRPGTLRVLMFDPIRS